jgi:hypothetical protein
MIDYSGICDMYVPEIFCYWSCRRKRDQHVPTSIHIIKDRFSIHADIHFLCSPEADKQYHCGAYARDLRNREIIRNAVEDFMIEDGAHYHGTISRICSEESCI